jgi:hypothetical protein
MLLDRCNGTTARRDCEPNSKKITKLEELVIFQHILDLDLRGFAPNLNAVRDMATSYLLSAVPARLASTGQTTLLSRPMSLKHNSIQRTIAREPYTKIQWL